MTGWLASVTDVREACQALEAGAHLIDAKDPRQGALGALPPAMVRAIVTSIAARAPVSATIGDHPDMDPQHVRTAIETTAACGVDFVKIGLFPGPALIPCLQALADCAQQHHLIGVLFADRQPDYRLIERLASLHFMGVMFDTADKAGGGLLRHQPPEHLAEFVSLAKHLGLICGLAGSLKTEDIARLQRLRPDYLGFRGALCRDQTRTLGLDAQALADVAARFAGS
jgi:uncharacterized protein (UPF0264 family)